MCKKNNLVYKDEITEQTFRVQNMSQSCLNYDFVARTVDLMIEAGRRCTSVVFDSPTKYMDPQLAHDLLRHLKRKCQTHGLQIILAGVPMDLRYLCKCYHFSKDQSDL